MYVSLPEDPRVTFTFANMSSTFWDQRYSGDELAYGEAPNDFLAIIADELPNFANDLSKRSRRCAVGSSFGKIANDVDRLGAHL